MTKKKAEPLFKLRKSRISGRGVFAARKIRKGTRIIEYQGERISTAEGDSRYDDDQGEQAHVLLFTVDKKTVIDGGVNSNEARYINHSCDPNCEAIEENKRIFIEAIRTIQAGEELCYDYSLHRVEDDEGDIEKRYPCRCGSAHCRGTLLEPKKSKKRKRKSAKKKS